MRLQRNVLVSLSIGCGLLVAASANAGQFLLDFAELPGAAADWDVLTNLVQDTANSLTDRSGSGDDDATLTALDDSFDPNNTAPPGVGAIYDGITVPTEAVDDYLFKTNDAAGTTARMRIDNLDPGPYHITVFEGRTTDPSQFAKIWVGDATGSAEPADENTGNFASGSATVDLNIVAGDTLWYRHLEDNTGGISGMMINPIPEPATAVLFGLGTVLLMARFRRRR